MTFDVALVSKLDLQRSIEGVEAEDLECEVRRYSTKGIHVRWPALGAEGYNYWFTCILRHRKEQFIVTAFLRQPSDQTPPGQQDFHSWPAIADREVLTTTGTCSPSDGASACQNDTYSSCMCPQLPCSSNQRLPLQKSDCSRSRNFTVSSASTTEAQTSPWSGTGSPAERGRSSSATTAAPGRSMALGLGGRLWLGEMPPTHSPSPR